MDEEKIVLVDLLHAELIRMTPAEQAAFRGALAGTLPAYVREVARMAKESVMFSRPKIWTIRDQVITGRVET